LEKNQNQYFQLWLWRDETAIVGGSVAAIGDPPKFALMKQGELAAPFF